MGASAAVLLGVAEVPISATGHFATSLQDRCAALAGTS